ncbi:MAG: hypothetical protein GC184_04820 [Rhizobiales bacterium]|nr:hypothetical protein [Hyphomicrobiales bacterium]
MIESLILVALGFLIATLFSIIALQFVWRRAVTLTTRRMGIDAKTLAEADEYSQAGRTIPELEIALHQREQEISVLAERNAHMAEAYANEQRESENLRQAYNTAEEGRLAAEQERDNATATVQSLRNDIDGLNMRLANAAHESEERAQKLAAMQQRIATFEATIAAEVTRQIEVESHLKQLGEQAARLAAELNESFGAVSAAAPLQASLETPGSAADAAAGAAPAETPATPDTTTPRLGTREREDFDAVLPEPATPPEAEDDLPPETMDLAERIEALKSGAPAN